MFYRKLGRAQKCQKSRKSQNLIRAAHRTYLSFQLRLKAHFMQIPILLALQIFAELSDHALVLALALLHSLLLVEQDQLPIVFHGTRGVLGHVQPFS